MTPKRRGADQLITVTDAMCLDSGGNPVGCIICLPHPSHCKSKSVCVVLDTKYKVTVLHSTAAYDIDDYAIVMLVSSPIMESSGPIWKWMLQP